MSSATAAFSRSAEMRSAASRGHLPGYVLDNARPETEQRFASLEACFDPITTAHLERVGLELTRSRGHFAIRHGR